jgi:hypothetical protein
VTFHTVMDSALKVQCVRSDCSNWAATSTFGLDDSLDLCTNCAIELIQSVANALLVGNKAVLMYAMRPKLQGN